jgi:hypothetical protein
MKTLVMALTLAATACPPALVCAEEFKSGDRVQGAAAFFLCGAREDLQTMKVLARQGDRESAIKLGTDRCETARPGDRYIVVETADDAVCIRRESDRYCLWAQPLSLHAAGPQ